MDSTEMKFPRIEADEVTRVATVELTFVCKDKPITIWTEEQLVDVSRIWAEIIAGVFAGNTLIETPDHVQVTQIRQFISRGHEEEIAP